MHRTTTTAITLAVALLAAATVSTGALAAAGAPEPSMASTSIEAPSATTAAVAVEPLPQSSDEPVDAPEPEETQLAPPQTAEPEPEPEPERTAASSTSTSVSSASRSTSSTVPLAAQPAPFGPATPAPSAPACASAITGTTSGAPSRTSPLGVAGTTSADLQLFAVTYNAIRVANCLAPVPFSNFRYDSCMEDRLFWIAEDPSTDPLSAWGHVGSQRSDGVPSVGCDGNLAGGLSNDGAIVAQKWWDSTGHRTSLYKPTFTGSTANVCILFAMTHGGVPDEPYSFTRSAARWAEC